MPQLTRAAMIQGLLLKCLRWPYQAMVMKTFDRTRRPMVETMGGSGNMEIQMPMKNAEF
jgi:hypothetical protein